MHEMMEPAVGFFSSQHAASDCEEGKLSVWGIAARLPHGPPCASVGFGCRVPATDPDTLRAQLG